MTAWWSRRRLHTQLAFASAALLALTIVITTWYNIHLQQRELLRTFERDAQSLAWNLATTSSYMVVTNKLDELEVLLLRSVTLPELLRLRVVSPGGDPLSYVVKREDGSIRAVYELKKTLPPYPSNVMDAQITTRVDLSRLILWQPIRTSTLLGWIELEMSLGTLSNLQAQVVKDSTVNALIALFFDVAVLLLILRVPEGYFRRAVQFAEQLPENPGRVMTDRGGSAEIGELITALNLSSTQLKLHEDVIAENHERLAVMNRTLEQKVEQRTAKLTTALASLRLLKQAVEQSPSAVIITDAKKRIESVNPGFVAIYGYRPQEVIGHLPAMLSLGQTPEETYKAMWDNLLSSGFWQGELLNRRKDGDKLWVFMVVSAVKDDRGAVTHYLAIQDDISERKQQEERLRYQANFDSLTGLPNRALLEDRLHQALRHDSRQQRKTALVYLDLDKFKPINDTFGHHIGDVVLVQTGERIRKAIRAEDTVARLGGDEFLMVLSGLDDLGALDGIAAKVQTALQEPFLIEGRELHVGSSLGIAIAPRDGQDIETLLSNADSAMYRAKQQGTNRYQYFTAEMNEQVTWRLQIRNELHHALDQNQVQLVYQPIFRADGRSIVAAEALLRWESPTLGEVSPRDFVPIAEESGIIEQLGDWVLDSACSAGRRFSREFDCAVSVNLSTVQLRSPGFAEKVGWLLREHQLAASHLHLELTEGTLFEDNEQVRSQIAALGKLGVPLAIDDFGTGYSSLSYLKRFCCGYLKIDPCFVTDLCESPDSEAIVTAIIQLAHSLHMEVIAEGVERKEQLAKLVSLGCDLIQGFYLAPPQNHDDFIRLLTARSRQSS